LTHTYGPSGVFCWIATTVHTSAVHVMTLIYYLLTWMIILCNCVFVVRLIFLLRKELQNEKDLADKYTNKLKWYPLIQIISYLPATVNRVYGIISDEESFTLMLIQIIFDSLTGLAFSLVYGFNSNVRNALGNFIGALCCKKKQRGSVMSEGESIETTNRRSLTSLDESVLP
jgi:hypothetical protein